MSSESQAIAFVYYQITQLSEQKYGLAVPFAEHNFGLFGRNFSCSNRYQKHYFRVSFAILYLQICIFYHGITSLSSNKCWIDIRCSFLQDDGLPIPDKD